MRTMKFKDALSEGLCQAMASDPSVFVIGIGVNYSSHVFGTTTEACKRWPDRVSDVPAMENALTGIAIGAATMGKRPVVVHARSDFMPLAADMLINLAAKFRYMYGGNAGTVPVVTRAIIGRGWGQGATHSQSLHSLFGHFPGLAVVMPATSHAAKGLTVAALTADHPTVILEHRSLFETTSPENVPEGIYVTPIGKAKVVREGSHLTIVATSYMVHEARLAAEVLAGHGVDVEIIDPQSIRPLDEETILASVHKTGHLLVADVSHELCGFASEVTALVAEHGFADLKSRPRRLTLPDCPTPVAKSLEEAFYPTATTIARLAYSMLYPKLPDTLAVAAAADDFKGPY